MTNDNIKEQVANMASFFERYTANQKHNLLVNIACLLNEMQKKSEMMAEPSEYAEGYKDAIEEIKNGTGIKDTFYELYQDTPPNRE